MKMLPTGLGAGQDQEQENSLIKAMGDDIQSRLTGE
jgi:hypothetical protein